MQFLVHCAELDTADDVQPVCDSWVCSFYSTSTKPSTERRQQHCGRVGERQKWRRRCQPCWRQMSMSIIHHIVAKPLMRCIR